MKYRAEIDGLRAVAVVAVILFHAEFPYFSGGFVGVDVFFVISGFLITGIIYNEIQAGSFSLIRFYERRVRRILPALLFISVATIPFAWIWMLPHEFYDFAKSLVAVSLFSSNILFWREHQYFSAASDLKPLLHTWSLAVEEQFYVIFPLFLLFCRNLKNRLLTTVLLSLSALSFGAAQWINQTHPDAVFYLLPMRAWELLLGAILAVNSGALATSPSWMRNAASALGLALIFYAVVAFDENTQVSKMLLPALGTTLILAFATPATIIGKILCLPPIVGLGLISYSSYLWHQPLFAFARMRLLNESPASIYVVLTVLAFVLAYFSWRYIELPFRDRRMFSTRNVFLGSAAVSGCISAFGLLGYIQAGIPGRLPLETVKMAFWVKDGSWRADRCGSAPGKFIDPGKSCIHGDPHYPAVNLIGDSHATKLAYQFAVLLAPEHFSLRQLTYDGCTPVVGFVRLKSPYRCMQYNEAVKNFLLSSHSSDIVVLVSRWTLFFEGNRFDNREGGIEEGRSMDVRVLGQESDFDSSGQRIETLGKLTRDSIQKLLDGGKKVVLVYPTPAVGWDVPVYLARENLLGIHRWVPLSTSYAVFKRRTQGTYEQLDQLRDDPSLIRIKPEDVFCNTVIPGRCIAQFNGEPLYVDDDHLNSQGSALLADKIIAEMKRRSWLENRVDSLSEARMPGQSRPHAR